MARKQNQAEPQEELFEEIEPDFEDETETGSVEPVRNHSGGKWKQMVKIKLPRPQRGELNYIIASVNGRNFKIMRGVEVEVPLPIAKVIEYAQIAEEEADVYAQELIDHYQEMVQRV